jgi:hypothetical protein
MKTISVYLVVTNIHPSFLAACLRIGGSPVANDHNPGSGNELHILLNEDDITSAHNLNILAGETKAKATTYLEVQTAG